MARRQQYHMVKIYRLRQIWRHPTMTLVQLIVPCMMYPAYQRLQRQLFNKDHNSSQRISKTKHSTSKRQTTIPRRNGQTTAVPHGENVRIASDMEAYHNDTRSTDRPLYDVSSLSTPSTYGPSTSTVQQLRTTTASKLYSNSGPRDAGCSTRTTTAGKLSSKTRPGDA